MGIDASNAPLRLDLQSTLKPSCEMPLQVFCPQGHRFSLAKQRLGDWVNCPECGEPFRASRASFNPPTRPHDGHLLERSGPESEDAPWSARRTPGGTPSPKDAPLPPEATGRDGGTLPGDLPMLQPPIRTDRWGVRGPGHTTIRGVGLRHDKVMRRTAIIHAMGIASIAAAEMLPAAAEMVEHFRAPESPGVALWAYVILWIACVQLGYAVFLVLLPDWASAWVVAQACLLISAIYAIGLSAGLFAGGESEWIVQFGLADQHHAGHLTRWCLLMLSLLLLVTYLLGRFSLVWHHRQTRGAQLGLRVGNPD